MQSPEHIFNLLGQIDGLEAQQMTLNRGEFLTTQGDVERHLYYIHSGAIHAFYVSEHEEYSIRFGYEGSLMTSIPSFYNQKPSDVYLQAIRKTQLTAYTRSSFYEVMQHHDQLKGLYHASLESLAEQQMEREIDLLTSSPLERLKRVQARSPQLFQQIPHKYIASYLRMTPETLSRIMNS